MEPISSVLNQSAETTIHTAGGAYIGGNVVAETFIGRDQYNYYFIGLAPLVHDPTRRFHNFLNEYLGTPNQPVPFGGRQAQLEELHRWLNDADVPPYYLMTAEAGRGKSALVCRWMEEVRQQRPEMEVIFIPISIRFETAAQDTVFAALAARLAQFYDEPLKPAALSGTQWQGVCESYLDRTPPAGKQLLIILDGLDEATGWRFGAGFFSTNPPPGLRVLVTARLRVGESAPQGWAATLGWHERLTRMAPLPPLSRIGVEEALASMGAPLAGLANQSAIVEQLYRLTEGDPLLVRLYVQEFEKQKATVGTLNSAALQQMTPGLQGYFDQWWKGQKAQWRAQGNDPEKEEAHLRLLLDALAAALGPVTLDDLAQLHPELGSSRLIRAQLQSVERWVIGDGKTQGYSYSHARLGYYFWEQLSDKEQAAWDERFCAWGATTLAALNAEQLDPKAAPVYLLRHYSEHLERSHASAEMFYALISNGWRIAWEWVDVSYGGFLNDLNCVWERANRCFDPTKPGKAVLLTQQTKVALCQSSVAALGNNMSVELLVQAVKCGLRTNIQAIASVKLIFNEVKRSEMLVALAPYLPKDLIHEVLVATKSIKDRDIRTWALSHLMSYLSEAERLQMLEEVISIACSVQEDSVRVQILCKLIPQVSETNRIQLRKEALSAVRSMITGEYNRVKLLGRVAILLPQIDCLQVLGEAFAFASIIEEYPEQVKALGTLLPYLSQTKTAPLREKVLAIVFAFNNGYAYDGYDRAWTFIPLLAYLSADERVPVLEEVESAAHLIQNNFDRMLVLLALMPYLPESRRANVLGKARKVAGIIESASKRAELLSQLALYLPEPERKIVLEEALIAERAIEDAIAAAKVVDILASHLPEVNHEEVMTKALASARSINREFDKAMVLGILASHLPNSLLEEVLIATREFQEDFCRSQVLQKLAPRLTGVLLSAAITEASTIQDNYQCAWALSQLAPHLLEAAQLNEIKKILAKEQMLNEMASYTEDTYSNIGALVSPFKPLENLSPEALMTAYGRWVDKLPVLASIPRPQFLRDLASLMPFILALAGDETPQAAEGIYQAIQEVCGWWP